MKLCTEMFSNGQVIYVGNPMTMAFLVDIANLMFMLRAMNIPIYQCSNRDMAGSSTTGSADNVEVVDDIDNNNSLDLSQQSFGEPIDCDTCNGMIVGNEWYICTQCNDFTMCIDCWNTKQHSHHRKYTNKFHEYDHTNHAPCCESCGILFNENSEVYQCTSCVDYALCKSCKSRNMHYHHKAKLKCVTLSEYQEDL